MAEILHIYSSLVPPADGDEPAEIVSSEITLEGKLYGMLANVYDRADKECDIPIRFLSEKPGKQYNQVREALIALVAKPTLDKATKLGQRLSSVTTHRSGLGLLFLIFGKDGGEQKLLLSRFPANPGILAEATAHGLSVSLVERVFMKNVAAYKAALYRSAVPAAEFWEGTVVDKQLTQMGESVADYWIKEFLRSDFRTTSKAGSRRLAEAMRTAAIEQASVEEKHQLISALTLVAGVKGKAISARGVLDRFALPGPLRDAVISHLPTPDSADAAFVLDADEFRKVAAFRSMRLDNGGVLTAPMEQFDHVFRQEVLDAKKALVRISTTGRIVDERIKRREQ